MNSSEPILQLLAIGLLLLMLFAILRFTLSWVISESEERGVSPLIIFFLVVICFPFGLILWMMFRPPPMIRQRVPVERNWRQS